MQDFLPVTRKEMKERGWEQADFVYVTGDAYVDHPSFGTAIISRLLESRGYKVGIISQPDWRKKESIQVFGEPRLGFLVSAGNMDSMVNHYTVSKKHRQKDSYSPGGKMGLRPDRAVIVYSNLIRQTYKKTPIILGGIPALEEIKFSLTSNRGCFGGCNFCALTFHQGRILQTRSHESLIREAERMTKDPEFKGYIHDVGGPTADFRQTSCQKQLTKGVCKNKQCLFPEPCKNLTVDHSDYVSLLRKLRKLSGVKKVFIRSGVRFDYVVADRDKTFLRELVEHHVSGQLRVAPEHVSDQVLKYMGKPSHSVYEKFLHEYDAANKKTGKQQYAVPYFMSSHPGCTMKEAVKLAEYVRDLGFTPEQVQDFYPTPSTLSTCMYYTGIHPLTGEKVYVPRNPHEKAIQRALMQYKNPENRELVLEGLKIAGRMDLVGYGPKCLIRPIREHSKNTSSESRSDKKRRSSGKTKTADRTNRIGGKQANVRTQTNTRKNAAEKKKTRGGRR